MQQPPEGNYQPPTQPPYSQQPTQQPYNPQHTPMPPPPYNYGAYPPQQPLAMPKKPRRWPWIVAIIFAFIFGDMVGHSGHTTTTDTTATVATSNTTAITQPAVQQQPAKPQKPMAWTTVQTFNGNGNQKTAVFAVNDNWRIRWSCTPDSQANSIGGYDFYVSVDNSDTSMADWNALSGSCKPGSVSTVTNEHQSGNVYLDVTSGGGPWTITVQEMK